ncbi:MAG TPA: cellulase family glycosylhydrolase [Verrucomicrobiae bacterium]|nr:cellulase family glycosylhydrolase [Verrucomicrobiae bacterium]
MLPLGAFAQLPTPTYGWNLGNTLEPPCGEGCWGPPATQALINGVANAGFNTIRIPCAWDSHANQSTYQIDPAFMARVKQVVDWCYATNLYVIINDHWDGGWLENNIGTSVDPTINAKMNSYWTQIATNFAGYDNHLLFAGANEPNVTNAAQMSTLTTYYNTFINAVRSTGGNNTNRWLVVQGPNTDIDTTYSLMNTLPTDSTPGRLMVEVHYYSPYQFCLMSSDADWGNMFYFWGAAYHSTTLPSRNPTWGEESYLDAEFQEMADKFVSQGIPVVLGEFEAMKRTTADYPDLTGANVDLHLASRTYFDWYVVDSAHRHGLSPFYWDTPGDAQLFDWTTGAVDDPDGVRALTGGAALPPPGALPPVPLPWMTQDIGTVGVSGTAGFTNSVFTLVGAGGDIQGTADAFRFVYVTATGDCTIIARVSSVQNVNPWSKAGVMIRASLDAGAANAFVAMTPSNGVTWQYRSSAGGGTTWNNTGGLSAPYWVRLVRSGNTFTGYRSSNGTTWTQQGTTNISMGSTAYIGLALTSHNSSTLCTATFDNVAAPGWPTSLPPAAPKGLTAVAGSGSVALSWSASDTATNYYVKRSTTSGTGYTTIATNASLAFTDIGLNNGTTYYYVVSAVNASGESTNSSEVSATPLSEFQSWQLTYFGSTNCASCAGNADFDGDGTSNTNEFLAGTDPTDSASAFRILSILSTGNDVVVTWQAGVGKTNALQAGTLTNYTDVSGPIAITVTPTNATEFGGATNAGPRFYRIRLIP